MALGRLGKTHIKRDAKQVRRSAPAAEVSVELRERYPVEDNRDIDADEVARAEAALEACLPTRVLNLKKAQAWLETIAHAEDIDPPILLKARMSKEYEGLAVYDNHAILVRNSTPTQMTLLHELAHFMGSSGHGSVFRKNLTELLRRHLSIQHALIFTEALKSQSSPSLGQ
jgi:hypothetical protein